MLFRSYIHKYAYFIRIHVLTEVENLNFESRVAVNIIIVIYSYHVMLLWVYLCFYWILRETCNAWKISIFFVKRAKELWNFWCFCFQPLCRKSWISEEIPLTIMKSQYFLYTFWDVLNMFLVLQLSIILSRVFCKMCTSDVIGILHG